VLYASPAAVAAAPPGAVADRHRVSGERVARRPAAGMAGAPVAAAAAVMAVAGGAGRVDESDGRHRAVHRVRADLADPGPADAGDAGLARLPLHELDDADQRLCLLVAGARPPAAPAGADGCGHARAVAGDHHVA